MALFLWSSCPLILQMSLLALELSGDRNSFLWPDFYLPNMKSQLTCRTGSLVRMHVPHVAGTRDDGFKCFLSRIFTTLCCLTQKIRMGSHSLLICQLHCVVLAVAMEKAIFILRALTTSSWSHSSTPKWFAFPRSRESERGSWAIILGIFSLSTHLLFNMSKHCLEKLDSWQNQICNVLSYV